MGEEIAFENGQISDFHGLVTLTLDRVILHTIMHQSLTSTYIPNFIVIEKTFRGRSRDTKTRTKIKNPAPISFWYCAIIYESVVICRPIINEGGDSP